MWGAVMNADDCLEHVIARCEEFIGCHIVNGGALDERLAFAWFVWDRKRGGTTVIDRIGGAP
jgi:hypothetical protein